ncbi:CbtA family protein [Sediminimonas qiaohouensis]|uniref:CbtA family protein n=1 Tax=Sediminimonas qiaohouensis TaxID=552061 RepID=UPI0004292B0F|nr:CbtA family protein [Sediminimonas qiaohouensis]
MLIRMLTGGLIAGFVAGLLATALHFALLQDLILQAELYESGEKVHFDASNHSAESGAAADDGHGDHTHAHDSAASDFGRNALTVLFGGLIYAGYGLMLAAALQVARQMGYQISLTAGVLWGVAGFVTFQMAPSMGLSPELPGTIAADISDRQIWWFGTMIATGAGLALMAYGRTLLFLAIGTVLIALPHIIGAPVLDTFYGVAPPEMAGEFATRVLGVGLVAWLVLGGLTARFTAPDPA